MPLIPARFLRASASRRKAYSGPQRSRQPDSPTARSRLCVPPSCPPLLASPSLLCATSHQPHSFFGPNFPASWLAAFTMAKNQISAPSRRPLRLSRRRPSRSYYDTWRNINLTSRTINPRLGGRPPTSQIPSLLIPPIFSRSHISTLMSHPPAPTQPSASTSARQLEFEYARSQLIHRRASLSIVSNPGAALAWARNFLRARVRLPYFRLPHLCLLRPARAP